MRTLILAAALLLIGCGTSEPIDKTASPIGCWSAPGPQTLALRHDGTFRLIDADQNGAAGTWQMQEGALIFDDGAVQRWQIVDLTVSDMWTDGGAVVHWQSIACAP